MLKTLLELFQTAEPPKPSADHPDVMKAAAALMIEAAMTDGTLDSSERTKIERILIDHYDLTPTEAANLIADATEMSADSTGFHAMTHVIKEAYDQDQRVKLIEHLWEVADADGELHDFEHNLIRRVAGLLYVDDRTRAQARKTDRKS